MPRVDDLHNTRLEPLHRPKWESGCGECTSVSTRRHLPSLPKRLVKLSCDERPDGRLPAFAWGDVASDATPIHPITGWHSLVPSSHARTSMGLPYGLLSLKGDIRGYHVPLP